MLGDDAVRSASLSGAINNILAENELRNEAIRAMFNPITGEGSIGERRKIGISDFPIPVQYIPARMMQVLLVRQLVEAGSVEAFFHELTDEKAEYTNEERQKIIEQYVRIRCRHDFAFWAALYVFIKKKGGGEDILFRLNRPQRKLIARLEKKRLAGKPIRLILLKARQWGGSTAIQIYMAWLQLIHKVGLNSLIVGHVKDASNVVKDMFDRMIKEYPISMLYKLGEEYNEKEPKMVGVGNSGNIHRIPQRNCKIMIGTAEKPDSARGGDYNLVHCTEVGLWKKTEGKTPEDIIRSACSGILLKPYTMIVYESTANGTGNFFHREYLAAKNGKSQFDAMFVAWYEIEQYAVPFVSIVSKHDFASWLYNNRNNEAANSDREEPGTYLWWLWQQGATLEAINWYIQERSKYTSHADMASEYPSNDIEAFTFSGRRVFSAEDVEQFRAACRPPKWKGEIYGRADEGEQAIENLRFQKEENGRLFMWQDVERDEEEEVLDRYLVIVDVGKGHTEKADFADILVIDRLYMMDGEQPTVAAEWHGHIDMDKLAWKAAQVAAYYNNALLVIESNTLETNNTKGEAEYILTLVRDVYGSQLYARKQSAEDVKQGLPKKYGFHTNTLTKPLIIHNLKTVVREHLYIEREEECLDEYLTYVETDKGGFEANEGYHDDRLMTRAIGMQICFHEMDIPRIVKKNESINKIMKKKAVSAATI
ncbi:MAG: terminase [Bacteroidaceae bacterium]|nr:terminase [Bacteroidaceae bacterium]